MASSTISAIGEHPLVGRRAQRTSGAGVEQAQRARIEMHAHPAPDPDAFRRGQACLDWPGRRLQRDDLRRAKILGRADAGTKRRGVVEPDMLGPHTKGEITVRTLSQLREQFVIFINGSAVLA